MAGFLSKLFGRADPKPSDEPISPEAAAAALLVEAALVDGVYADLESDRIAMILLESFDFDADRADTLLAQGEALAEEAV
ncbi:MAG: TerB family tellurite resistance protein, partial [Pseudomonadota bacterium]